VGRHDWTTTATEYREAVFSLDEKDVGKIKWRKPECTIWVG
jgi:hypothetical protein